MEPRSITIKNAREHNLRDVSLELPRNKLICFTGVSGSGKSSLAFDTLYAEGQRRYVESLSTYARQFLGQFQKPNVDLITGLSPSISIQQKTSGWNPRSTVGTITQIHDYLRVLYARVGRPHCTRCGQPISAQTREQIVAQILALPAGVDFLILAPIVRGQKGEHRDLADDLLRRGLVRARVDGKLVRLSDDLQLDRNIRHDIEVVVDRLTIRDDVRNRLAEAVEAALGLGSGTLLIQLAGAHETTGEKPTRKKKKIRGRSSELPAGWRTGQRLFSSQYACVACGLSYDPPSPQLFSFNSPTGMCLTCDGLGTLFDFDPDLLVPNPSKSFLKLAIEPMRTRIGRWRRHLYRGVADHVGFDLNTPWKDLPQKARDALLYGTGDEHITFTWRSGRSQWKHGGTFAGVIEELRSKYRKANARFVREYYEKYMRQARCPACNGNRLNEQARAVRLGGKTLPELTALSIADVLDVFENLELTPIENIIAEEVLKEIRGRLAFLMNVGLHYLTLDRAAPTLSGGESQRIRLASQIGSGLVGVLYVLDEPSIGLHARDNRMLLASLEQLRDAGNTVIVVEHDEETMRAADWIVDFGPGPGVRGGRITGVGTLDKIKKNKDSITGDYLAGRREIPVPKTRRPVTPPEISPRATAAGKRKTTKKTAKKARQAKS